VVERSVLKHEHENVSYFFCHDAPLSQSSTSPLEKQRRPKG
jgi:hypothetical protein